MPIEGRVFLVFIFLYGFSNPMMVCMLEFIRFFYLKRYHNKIAPQASQIIRTDPVKSTLKNVFHLA